MDFLDLILKQRASPLTPLNAQPTQLPKSPEIKEKVEPSVIPETWKTTAPLSKWGGLPNYPLTPQDLEQRRQEIIRHFSRTVPNPQQELSALQIKGLAKIQSAQEQIK